MILETFFGIHTLTLNTQTLIAIPRKSTWAGGVSFMGEEATSKILGYLASSAKGGGWKKIYGEGNPPECYI